MRRTGGRVGVLVYWWARRVIVRVLLVMLVPMLRRRTMTMRVMLGMIMFGVVVLGVVVMRVVRHHVVGARGETRGAAGVASIGWRRVRMCGVCM